MFISESLDSPERFGWLQAGRAPPADQSRDEAAGDRQPHRQAEDPNAERRR
jgi:hypothetical protein